MATDLARLVVSLEAETSKYQRDLEKAQRRLTAFEKSAARAAQSIGTALGVAAAAVAVGFVVMAKHALENADHLNKLSQSTGLTTESLSVLQYAAGLADVSNEELGLSLQRLSKSAVDAAENIKGPAAEAFTKLGVDVIDPVSKKVKNLEQIFLDTADAVATSEGIGRAAALQDVLGRGVQKLIPLLSGGSEGILGLRKELEQLGGVISTNTAKAAEEFNDNLSRLKQASQGVVNVLVEGMLPALLGLSVSMVDFAKNGDSVRSTAEGIKVIFQGIVLAGATVVTALVRIGSAIGAMAAISHALARTDFAEAFDIGEDQIKKFQESSKFLEELTNNVTGATDATKKFGAENKALGAKLRNIELLTEAHKEGLKITEAMRTPTQVLAAETEKLNGLLAKGAITQDVFNLALKKAKDDFARVGGGVKAVTSVLPGLIDALNKEAATLGFTTDQVKIWELQQAKASSTTVAFALKLQASTKALEDQKVALEEGKALTQDARTPTEVLGDTFERLSELEARGAISADTFSAALKKAGTEFEATDAAAIKLAEDKKILDDALAATPTAKLEEQRKLMVRLATAYMDGEYGIRGSTEAIALYGEVAQTALGTLPDKVAETTDKFKELANEAARNMQGAFADFLFDPFAKGTQGMLEGFSVMLRKMAAEFLAHEAFKAMAKMGGATEGEGIGDVIAAFIGSFAGGGMMPAGRMALVGEQGPELVMPGATSRVLNNRDTQKAFTGQGGSNVTINQSFAPGTDTRTIDQAAMKMSIVTQRSMRRNG